MGRNSTGARTTGASRKLDLRFLLKNNYIQKDRLIKCSMSWTDGSTIGFESYYSKDDKYIKVNYSITDRQGNKFDYDYKINLVTVKSNLGKGEILYLECPESGKRARVLFMSYGHHKYIHRDWYLEKYGLRLYYNTQISSKRDYSTKRYFKLDGQIKALESSLNVKFKKTIYNGKPTKEFDKLEQLKFKRFIHDHKRTLILDSLIKKMYI